MGGPVRLLVVDDHTLLRTALCNTLRVHPDIDIVAEAGSGEEAVRAAQVHRPDVVLLDIEMPGQHISETVRQLGQIVPRPEVMILSMYDDRALEADLVGQGVRAYLHKSITIEALTSAIDLVAGSKHKLTISVSRSQPATAFPPGPDREVPLPSSQLSSREVEVLRCVSRAMSNRQIASSLGITEGTVKRHLRNIFAKLDAVSRLDAVNKAAARAIIPPAPGGWPRLPGDLPSS